jgi:calcineurin-like phosphoesterase family protein
MSKRFWLADAHFSYANIVKYCHRPTLRKGDLDENGNWTSPETALAAAERMDSFLIRNINGRVKPEDVVMHVGDFINYGAVKGVPGLKNKPRHYLDQLTGRWVFLLGNHDRNNNLRPDAHFMITEIGGLRIFVSHYPIENLHMFDPKLVDYVINCTAFQICGHVHQSWKYKYHIHKNGKYLMYNVGVDAHRYYPISDDEIIGDISHIKRNA